MATALKHPVDAEEKSFQSDNDSQLHLLAQKILNYSVGLKSGNKVVLEMADCTVPLAKVLIEEIYLMGGIPFVREQ